MQIESLGDLLERYTEYHMNSIITCTTTSVHYLRTRVNVISSRHNRAYNVKSTTKHNGNKHSRMKEKRKTDGSCCLLFCMYKYKLAFVMCFGNGFSMVFLNK